MKLYPNLKNFYENVFMFQFFTQNSEIIVRLTMAVGLGLLIGGERILVRKEAGMKTHALVSLGAAVFIVISEMIALKYGGGGGVGASPLPLPKKVRGGRLWGGVGNLYGE